MGQLEHSVRLLKIFNVIVHIIILINTYSTIHFIKEDYQQVYVYILIFTSTIFFLLLSISLSLSLSLFQPPTSSPFQLVLLIR